MRFGGILAFLVAAGLLSCTSMQMTANAKVATSPNAGTQSSGPAPTNQQGTDQTGQTVKTIFDMVGKEVTRRREERARREAERKAQEEAQRQAAADAQAPIVTSVAEPTNNVPSAPSASDAPASAPKPQIASSGANPLPGRGANVASPLATKAPLSPLPPTTVTAEPTGSPSPPSSILPDAEETVASELQRPPSAPSAPGKPYWLYIAVAVLTAGGLGLIARYFLLPKVAVICEIAEGESSIRLVDRQAVQLPDVTLKFDLEIGPSQLSGTLLA